MRSHEVHSSTSASEEAPITLSRDQLAAIVQKAMEDALAQGSGRANHPSSNLSEQGDTLHGTGAGRLPPENNEGRTG